MQVSNMQKIYLYALTLFMCVALFQPIFVSAQTLQNNANSGFPQGSIQNNANSGFPQSNLQNNANSGCPAGRFCFQNPLKVSTICGLIQSLLSALVAIGTPVAVLFLVYSGFLFVVARGSTEGLLKAKQNLLWVLIGIGIFFAAWVLGQVIANTINTIQPGTVNATNSCN